MRRFVILCAALCALAACETVKGVGADINAAGRALDRTF